MGGRQEVKLQHAGTCCDHAEPASLVKVCLSHTPTFLLVLYFDTTGRDTMPLLSSACWLLEYLIQFSGELSWSSALIFQRVACSDDHNHNCASTENDFWSLVLSKRKFPKFLPLYSLCCLSALVMAVNALGPLNSFSHQVQYTMES